MAKLGTGPRLAAALSGVALVVSSLVASPATALPTDDLSVAFGGSLVGATAYTTQGTEVMKGVLRRVNGAEVQNPGEVVLAGGTQGLRFEASQLSLGTSGGLGTQSFIVEARFTPTASTQATQAPIISAGGNFSIRYEGNAINYGYDTDAGGSWVKYRGTATTPTINTEHVISLHYRSQADGSVIMDAMLDGAALPSVTGATQMRLSNSLQNVFGFGNDVHPAALTRGFVGKLHEIRVASTNGAPGPSVFQLQPTNGTTPLLHATWDGTLDATYTKTATEVNEGTVTKVGNASVTGGNLVTTGTTDGVVFAPTTNPFSELYVKKGFVAETKFTASAAPANLATLIGVGGNFFVRFQNSKLRVGYSGTTEGGTDWSDYFQEYPLPATGQEHVISVAYDPKVPGPGAKVTVWIDRIAVASIDGAKYLRQAPAVMGQVSFGNDVHPAALTRGFVGSQSESRFATLDVPFQNKAFVLQTLDPVQGCDDITLLQPGNYQDVKVSDCDANIIRKAALLRPTDKQATWQQEGLTAFIHFGVNTFYNQEWGHGTEDPTRVDPTDNIDPDEWIRQLRDAGYRTAIITLKHHDGFMLWPTRYSDYDIARSPWKNGQGDIAKELSDAARKYGMKVGFYLSPADSNAEIKGIYGNGSAKSIRTIPTLVPGDDREGKDIPTFTYQATDYGAFFLNTLYEVMTQYGELHELWFDGAGGNTNATEIFDYPAFYDLIHKLQPGANIAVGGRDIRWIGNEQGEARFNEWSTIPIKDAGPGKIDDVQPGGSFNQNLGSDQQLIDAVRSGAANKLHWWPAEADMKLTQGWFAHASDVPKSPSSLLNYYMQTVGRNSVMLLNVPPTTTGRFAPASVDAIDGFAAERRKAFTLDHALGVPATVGTDSVKEMTNGNSLDGKLFAKGDYTPIVLDLGAAKTVNRIGLAEDIRHAGMTVKTFKVEAEVGGAWTQVASSGVIGSGRYLALSSAVTAQKWRITVTDARDAYAIADIHLWGHLAVDPGKPSNIYIDCSAPVAGNGTESRPYNSLEQLRKVELAVGATLNFKAGVDCADSDLTFWGYGTATNPVEVKRYGSGSAPLIGGQPIADRFTDYATQSWVVDSMVEPTPTVTLTTTSTATATATATTTATLTSTATATATATATSTATATATATSTATATATATSTATATATVTASGPGTTSAPTMAPGVKPYEVPGYHSINGREWFTNCEPYSQTFRCRTDIWATQIVKEGGTYVHKTGWVFNNLTYLPMMTRAQWGNNPLARNATWTTNGRTWMTECDTARTGRNACRSYLWAQIISATPKAGGGYTYSTTWDWVFNNIVRFKV